jgi:hypothetical protein
MSPQRLAHQWRNKHRRGSRGCQGEAEGGSSSG